jgi:hypothetical protein
MPEPKTVCCVCGRPIQEHDHPSCPGCLRPICSACHAFLPYVWSSRILKDGSMGAVRLCLSCRNEYETTPITPHPYLG